MASHVVQLSGGVASAQVARIVAARHGVEDTTLLFADTNAEDRDLHRFNREVSELVGIPITTVADGRTPIEVNAAESFLGNSRLAPCSKLLKQVPCRKWLQEHTDPAATTLYVGIDSWEAHRVPGIAAGWQPWRVEFPLMEPQHRRPKADLIDEFRALGIREPRLYRLGYPHNNCGGACVRAGQAQWVKTLRVFPGRFAEHEQAELDFQAKHGSDVAYIREQRDGEIRPLPLLELRRRVESADEGAPGLFDPDDWGGCGCFTDAA